MKTIKEKVASNATGRLLAIFRKSNELNSAVHLIGADSNASYANEARDRDSGAHNKSVAEVEKAYLENRKGMIENFGRMVARSLNAKPL